MPDLMPTEIVEEVRAVLAAAQRGKGTRPNYLTAFQIVERLPELIRERLIRERGIGGTGTGDVGAPSIASRAAVMAGAEVDYIDTVGLSIQIAGRPAPPSFQVCAIYRLPVPAAANV